MCNSRMEVFLMCYIVAPLTMRWRGPRSGPRVDRGIVMTFFDKLLQRKSRIIAPPS